MGSAPRNAGKLAEAADNFERALGRYERLSAELARTSVQSEKSLERKRRLLEEFSESEAELGGRLKALLAAMNDARERQQHCMEVAVTAATDLRARAEQFSELMAQVATLGERARTASQPAGPLMTEGDQKLSAQALVPLDQASEQIQGVLADADAMARSASEQNWPEVARDINSLRQQLSSMHAKLARLRTDVAKRTLS
jgi:ABC-type transporter Mla subunit MlaD